MLYLWPYITFFSWPTLLPSLLPVILVTLPDGLQQRLHTALRPARKHVHRLPQLAVFIPFVGLALSVVHFNTVIHPFTLADNRHYTFYVFRILRRHSLVKYFAAPFYIFLGWAVISALGNNPVAMPTSKTSKRGNDGSGSQEAQEKATSVSTVVLWLVVCTLCLATAPLVEPRYYILPWVLWRLYVPLPPQSTTVGELLTLERSKVAAPKRPKGEGPSLVALLANVNVRWSVLILELAWAVTVNILVGYMFLRRGFRWVGIEGEEAKTQRFMW